MSSTVPDRATDSVRQSRYLGVRSRTYPATCSHAGLDPHQTRSWTQSDPAALATALHRFLTGAASSAATSGAHPLPGEPLGERGLERIVGVDSGGIRYRPVQSCRVRAGRWVGTVALSVGMIEAVLSSDVIDPS